mgnify:CR=1 FL=1
MSHLKRAREVFDVELAAVKAVRSHLTKSFDQAVELIVAALAKRQKIVVLGVGKSGNIGRKIAATFTSTGSPAVLLDTVDAMHGDLGILNDGDVLLALSYSGETDELINLLPAIRRFAVQIVAVTAAPRSTLGQHAEVVLNVKVPKEACPFNMAPTASTTASLVMGDALAMAVLEARGFTAEDFALSHPGGSLGRRLLLKVDYIMHAGERLPVVASGTPLSEALLEMTRKGLGMTAIARDDGTLAGIFTDGDLRRMLDRDIDIRKATIDEVMVAQPITIEPGHLAAEALQIMETRKINGLMVCDMDHKPLGAFNMQDLLRAGVV